MQQMHVGKCQKVCICYAEMLILQNIELLALFWVLPHQKELLFHEKDTKDQPFCLESPLIPFIGS
jgi:hypothetical protein